MFYTPASGGAAGATYDAEGHDPAGGQFGAHAIDNLDEDFPDSGGTTSVLPGPGTGFPAPLYDDLGPKPVDWHGGADFALLVLRLVVGGVFIAHGLRDQFGLFHGSGHTVFEQFVTASGYKYAGIMSWVAGGVELGAGVLLVLGLFTPLAAAAALAQLANLVVLKWHLGFFAPGYELELILAAGAFTLLFAGPGRVALDRPTPWFRRPILSGTIFLVIGAAAAVAVLLVVRKHT